MTKFIDPPSGWRYGFPKPLPDPEPKDIYKWLVQNGYPQSLIDSMGEYFTCRLWEDDTPPVRSLTELYYDDSEELHY